MQLAIGTPIGMSRTDRQPSMAHINAAHGALVHEPTFQARSVRADATSQHRCCRLRDAVYMRLPSGL